MTNYGGFWQELRAYIAVTLIGWAQSIHFEETMATARAFTQLEDKASREKLRRMAAR